LTVQRPAQAKLAQANSGVSLRPYPTIPRPARFEQGSLTEKQVVKLWVIDPDGRRHKIPTGTIEHVGAIMRLASPLSEIETKSAIEHHNQ
jgi:hypothetical protein